MASHTVFVTGASGFIAKHIVLQLLQAGHSVVGSVRKLDRGAEVADAVRPHLPEDFPLAEKLSFKALDLSSDEGWDSAMAGCDVLMHTASPFPLKQPENDDDIIRPAVDGTRRALAAAKAAGITRVILTSSAVAIMQRDPHPDGRPFSEADWSEPHHATNSPYGRSKLKAEEAAWAFVKDEAPELALTTINPVLVLGPPLDMNFGTSISIVERVLTAKDPANPRVGLPVVDVRDVAAMHVKALETEAAIGQRFLAANGFMWFSEIAAKLQETYPDRKLVLREAPNWFIRLLGLFDKEVKTILPLLGVKPKVSNAKAHGG